MLLFIIRVNQSIIFLPTVFDGKVIQCFILFTLNVVTFNCVIFPNRNKINKVIRKTQSSWMIYHIFSQSGGRYNLKVRADFCFDVRLDSALLIVYTSDSADDVM